MKNLSLKLSLLIIIVFAITGCKSDQYVFEDLGEPVKSFYSIPSTELLIKQEIVFTNASENADSYTWDFGDGTTSTEKNPTKTYLEAGAYTVKLKAVGAGGTGNYSKNLVIIDPDAIIPTDKIMYFIEYNNPVRSIRKMSLNLGSTPETILSISGKVGVGLAVDNVNGKMYYTDFNTTGQGKVWRMDFDGKNLEAVVSGIADPYSIAVNVGEGKIYWADSEHISRANLDGSQVETSFVTVTDALMRAVAFDSKTNKIYFYDVEAENLYVVNSDGSGKQIIVEGAYGYGIFVDEVNSKIYFEDRNIPAIMQANLDGTGVVQIAEVPSTRIYGMGIDYITKKFYWSDMSKGNIMRANYDGSKPEIFIGNLNSPRGFFIK